MARTFDKLWVSHAQSLWLAHEHTPSRDGEGLPIRTNIKFVSLDTVSTSYGFLQGFLSAMSSQREAGAAALKRLGLNITDLLRKVTCDSFQH